MFGDPQPIAGQLAGICGKLAPETTTPVVPSRAAASLGQSAERAAFADFAARDTDPVGAFACVNRHAT
jgi:hypothetical protein